MISVRVDPELEAEAAAAAALVGLKLSDLVRTGLHRVLAEIRQKGALQIAPRHGTARGAVSGLPPAQVHAPTGAAMAQRGGAR